MPSSSFVGNNTIAMSDITDRYEELQTELQDRHEEGQFMADFEDWIDNSRDNSDPIHAAFGEEGSEVQSAIEEYYVLRELLSDLAGQGGNHQFEGTWYPGELISEDYFQTYAQGLAEDMGAINKDAGWPNRHIDWEAAANALKADYVEQDFEGTTYYCR